MIKKTKISILILLMLSFLLCLSGCGNGTANTPDKETGLDVPDPLMLYSGDGLGFSFLYPYGTDTAYAENDGVYLYGGEEREYPYVLIYRSNKAADSPEAYFSACDKLMMDTFEDVQSTPIQDVKVGEKQLYLTRYQCSTGKQTLVIDRYLEPYPGFYIQYTAISEEAGFMNTPLYYAVSTLKTKEGAYKGAWSDKTIAYDHDEAGFHIEIPDMLDVTELTIGYMANSQDVVFLAIHCTEDHDGKPIYNRQDFIDRADADPYFVTELIGAGDSMTFSHGSKVMLDDVTFYSYPAELSLGSDAYNGAILVANATDTGCYLIYYGVREGCASYDATLSLHESCVNTFQEK